MKHQLGRKKLNLKSSHRRALIRNQAISLINNGVLVSTVARVKEVRRFAERLVTLARDGNTMQGRRKAHALLPYSKSACVRLFSIIAPRYTERPGGYTRIIRLGQRTSDTAHIARLEWVV